MIARMHMMRLFVVMTSLSMAPIALADDSIGLQERNGEPFKELSGVELGLFLYGKSEYQRAITPAEGGGPGQNKSNCGSCHGTGSIIGGPGTIQVTLFGADDKGSFIGLEHLGGPLFQLNSISSECLEQIPPEATIIVNRVTLGALAYGLVEAIDDADLYALEDPTDSDGDGISGRVHVTEALEDPGVPRAGKFGWKAQIPTILTFSADAAVGEMGLTNRLVPEETAPNGDLELLALCDDVADPEDGPDGSGLDFIDRVTIFQRYIAPPPQTPRNGMVGETIFNNIGCADCHHASFTTVDDPELESFLRDRTFRPYSDFLLHSMGTLGDGIRQGDAAESEMKTPTLWGLRWRDPMLHDGRVAGGSFEDRVTGAIEAHGPFGEGADSASNFAALSSAEKTSLILFLDSLGRNEFDYDGDEDVDINDFNTFKGCFATGTGITPEDPCAIGDIDQDGDCDLVDAGYFVKAYDGSSADCNENGIEDLLDILTGVGTDANGDGELDECVCLGDINGDRVVNGLDLSFLLGNWSTNNPESDLDNDGSVSGGDLAILLGEWGSCN